MKAEVAAKVDVEVMIEVDVIDCRNIIHKPRYGNLLCFLSSSAMLLLAGMFHGFDCAVLNCFQKI